jgi:type III restriction enzyme
LHSVSQVITENWVFNSAFRGPNRHLRFTEEGMTKEIIDQHRNNSHFVPIPRPRQKGQEQVNSDSEWTQGRIKEKKLVNQIHTRVMLWHEHGDGV